ncbi:MAG: hypothetical protein LKK09_03675 [Olsenella sp.]|jgi:hypothetical protein|nr:hypothetical protein [Olsenella sp.]MCI2123251.1 hypothetical protein [Olsenella sp.]
MQSFVAMLCIDLVENVYQIEFAGLVGVLLIMVKWLIALYANVHLRKVEVYEIALAIGLRKPLLRHRL